ncbi:MAG: DUF4865 family protein [Gordonia sp. (in: high G+C Gram-positive bacteria)]
MIAAQYEIALPADYDMGIIRRRIVERGAALDHLAGLGLKAYLIRDIADDSPVNAYAPFYLWRHAAALAAFHWGGQGFGGIVRDFGRASVRTWIGGQFSRGGAFSRAPGYALRRTATLPPDVDPIESAQALRHNAESILSADGVHSHAWGIDPTIWQTVEFTLHTDDPGPQPDPSTIPFRVLHLSTPEIETLR